MRCSIGSPRVKRWAAPRWPTITPGLTKALRWGTRRRERSHRRPPPCRHRRSHGRENAIYAKLADEVLVDSWNVANMIDRLIWKNRAMVKITLTASDSRQYRRALELARTIQNAESRTDAMLILAEAQCREGLSDAATESYQVAAQAAASIKHDGLRGVIVGYLVNSLISTGRFDDARACTAIYPRGSRAVRRPGGHCRIAGQAGPGGCGASLDRDRHARTLSLGPVPTGLDRRSLVGRAGGEQGVGPG